MRYALLAMQKTEVPEIYVIVVGDKPNLMEQAKSELSAANAQFDSFREFEIGDIDFRAKLEGWMLLESFDPILSHKAAVRGVNFVRGKYADE